MAPTKKKVLPPPQSVFLDRTHGEIELLNPSAGLVSYKNMSILVNPLIIRSKDIQALPPLDYVLLAAGNPNYFGDQIRSALKKKTKIISPPQSRGKLNQEGFGNVKGLGSGGRVLLKKEKGYLFVQGVTDQTAPVHTNGYFLEFDNGRTVYFTGALRKADSLREFLYSLRDDGKEIDMAIIDTKELTNTNQTAESISLLQPKLAVLIGAKSIDREDLDQKLKDQLFYGSLYFANPGDKIPF